jgi:predicted HicB family RNase H-like nuclease
MEHKGYTGIPFIDEESESLYGHVVGLRDVITFQGDTFAELTQSFRDSVDDYLEFCESLGRSPEKPFSGRLLLRIPPELHRKLSNAAEKKGMSLNSFVESSLRDSVEIVDAIPKGSRFSLESEGKVKKQRVRGRQVLKTFTKERALKRSGELGKSESKTDKSKQVSHKSTRK